MLTLIPTRGLAAGMCVLIAASTTSSSNAASLTATLGPLTNNVAVGGGVTVADLDANNPGSGVSFSLEIEATGSGVDPGTITGFGFGIGQQVDVSSLSFELIDRADALLEDPESSGGPNNVNFRGGGQNAPSFRLVRAIRNTNGPGAAIISNLRTVSFNLVGPVTAEAFVGQDFGIRVQQIEGTTDDSARLTGSFGAIDPGLAVVPSPAAVSVGCIGAGGVLLKRRRRLEV